jgi:hypothetical protein
MISRSFIQRTCVVLGLIALSVFLFYIGKGHTLYLDTNMITIDGKELRSHASAAISVNGKQQRLPIRSDRQVKFNFAVGGPKHTIVIVDNTNADNRVEKTFTIPTFMNRVVVSIPAILGNAPAEYWITEYTPPSLEDAPIEKMQYYQPEGEKP